MLAHDTHRLALELGLVRLDGVDDFLVVVADLNLFVADGKGRSDAGAQHRLRCLECVGVLKAEFLELHRREFLGETVRRMPRRLIVQPGVVDVTVHGGRPVRVRGDVPGLPHDDVEVRIDVQHGARPVRMIGWIGEPGQRCVGKARAVELTPQAGLEDPLHRARRANEILRCRRHGRRPDVVAAVDLEIAALRSAQRSGAAFVNELVVQRITVVLLLECVLEELPVGVDLAAEAVHLSHEAEGVSADTRADLAQEFGQAFRGAPCRD